MADVAKAVSGKVTDRRDLIGILRVLWRHIHCEMRKADKIVKVMDDIPTKPVPWEMGTGAWARTEQQVLENVKVPSENTWRGSQTLRGNALVQHVSESMFLFEKMKPRASS